MRAQRQAILGVGVAAVGKNATVLAAAEAIPAPANKMIDAGGDQTNNNKQTSA